MTHSSSFSNHCQLGPFFFSFLFFSPNSSPFLSFYFLFLKFCFFPSPSHQNNLLTKEEKWHLSFPSFCCFSFLTTPSFPFQPTLKVWPTASFLSAFLFAFQFGIVGQFGFSKLMATGELNIQSSSYG